MNVAQSTRPTSDPSRPVPVLEMIDIAKAFEHVHALRGVDLTVRRGETIALVGDNGAGKSTLMNILAGVLTPDSGRIRIDGRERTFQDPEAARNAGIEMVFQDLALFEEADVSWNVFAGRELSRPRGLRSLDQSRMRRRARELLDELGIDVGPVTTHVRKLSGGQRQMVAIARALAFAEGERILILDEPTAALGQAETAAVHTLIRRLRDRGVSIVLISHRIPEVLELADRIVVLRRGRGVACRPTAGCRVETVVDLIVAGRSDARDQADTSRQETP